MPCCGITIEYLYARLKAAEIPGSGTADRLLDELLSADQSPAGEIEKAVASNTNPETTAT
jgi:hypothetical protein